jgi:hypothetical protein
MNLRDIIYTFSFLPSEGQQVSTLKTVDNTLYETSKEAAIKRNLLAEDKEWEDALEEAESFRMPHN